VRNPERGGGWEFVGASRGILSADSEDRELVPKTLNFSIPFGECLNKLNTYNRSTTPGRRMAALLTVHLEVNRIVVLEGKLTQ
jgi:hypothetical protein